MTVDEALRVRRNGPLANLSEAQAVVDALADEVARLWAELAILRSSHKRLLSSYRDQARIVEDTK